MACLPKAASTGSRKAASCAANSSLEGRCRAIADELDVDDRRQQCRVARHRRDEILRLFGARPAEGEEMICADRESGFLRRGDISSERFVDPVTALGRLDDGEGNIVGRDPPPVDQALMVGNIDAADWIGVSVGRKAHEVHVAATRTAQPRTRRHQAEEIASHRCVCRYRSRRNLVGCQGTRRFTSGRARKVENGA